MTVKDVVKRVGAAVAVSAVAAGGLLATAAPASAASGDLVVCSWGTYSTYIVFPERGGWSTPTVWQGECLHYPLSNPRAVEPIRVYGTDGSQFLIKTSELHMRDGGIVFTRGDSDNPRAVVVP